MTREVGGGRAPRQPGQVRKEAAATSFRSGRLFGVPPLQPSAQGRRGGRCPAPRMSGLFQDDPPPADESPPPSAGPGLFGDRARGPCPRGRRAVSGAGAQIPPDPFQRHDRPGGDGAHAAQCLRRQSRGARLHAHRRARSDGCERDLDADWQQGQGYGALLGDPAGAATRS